MECHELIDDMERECLRSHNVHLVIHYDPVVTEDPELHRLKARCSQLLLQQDPRLSLHDFRLVPGRRHMNLIFDVALPSDLRHRRRELPELKSSNFNLRAFGERVALNMPVQGAAADVMKLAMIAVRNRLKTEGLQARLVLQVHDELIVECPEEEKETVAALLAEEMEGVAALSVPLVAEAHWGRNWLEAKG